MGYFKRWALATFGAFLVFLLYTLAVQPLSMISAEELLLLIGVSLGVSLVGGAIAAAAVRRNVAALLLVSQVLVITIFGVAWYR